MEEDLQPYARAHLLRVRPDVELQHVDAYVSSPEFRILAKLIDKMLLAGLERFLATSRNPVRLPVAAAPSAPPFPQLLTTPQGTLQPLALRDFSQPPAPLGERLSSMAQSPLEADAVIRPEPAPTAVPGPEEQAPALSPVQQPPSTQAALPQPELADAIFRLPNARIGVEYTHRIEPVDTSQAVVFLDLVVPDGLSLKADIRTGMVSGTPNAAGDYTVTAIYHFEKQSPSRQRRATINMSVTPDPRSMWKNLPSDPGAPYAKPDEQCSALRGRDMAVIAASKRGRSHAHVGSFRDDDYRIQHVADTGWYIVVVADGAGSARFSRRGAAIICEEAKKRIQTSLADTLLTGQIDAQAQAYAQARSAAKPAEQIATLQQSLRTSLSRVVGNAAYYAASAIFNEVAQRTDLGGVFKDYSSTALVAICKRYPFGTLCAAYWVGDGAIGVYSERDGISLLGDVDSGEYSGQTRFLDSTAIDHESLLNRTRFELVEDMTALVLMTDGVSDAKFETEARLNRAADWHSFWQELDGSVGFADLEAGKESKLLAWLDFWSQGNHDDRTIAIIY